ncbi:permease [Yersinia pseudotuberculosis]|uniref:putative ABC transporter permease subunit YbbP n=1 Tax=Yersinia pseudotuberculosis TaxID=633 RepID=UPI0005E1ECF5|nr:putative ABC transporter permease subunit YbbP [Yersinia pseudotuberculosis]MBO1549324.1 FtsX-like permease family protein [Yersinia pseudotuberculosis]MBO1569478.1 FtsX-like permease family protein [Yersinia pseudotuberculosis]MBO1584448.1 FtsX-like permease family protein [Yersinia pseudotuberculosis]MBO1633871.1 FtsX-like permease family protein [Yersinia pseudotuberculosis]CNH72109.1 permease [Yersinia pseudotuberculosis]
MIWRWFWREWRAPSLLIVWLALTLAVACVLALGTISDRMEKGLSQQSRDFLAGDRVLRAAHPVPEAWLQEAKQQGLAVSRQLSFLTMTFGGDRPQLAEVKATDLAYPLYGKLETLPKEAELQPGTVLVAPRLLALLGVKVGDMLDVGDTSLKIIGEIIQEPDAGFNPFQTAPHILINLADVEKTGAVQPGSRLTYRYMFAGTPEAVTQFSDWLTPQLTPEQRWYGLQESGGALGKSLQRAQQFLLLSALLTLLLSIAAVAVAMGHYCRSRYDLVAVLKTLGAGRRALRRLIIGQWLSVLALAGLCGSVIGLLFERLLVRLLAPVLPAELPTAGLWPWVWSMGSLVLISLLVGVRPYRQLLATQPLRVLRRDVAANVWPLRYFIPVMLLVVIGLLAWLMGGNSLLWAILGGMVVLALLLGGIGWGSLLLLRHLTVTRLSLRLAINRLLRQPWMTLTQLAAFSLSFMLLALLLVLRGDLLDRWQQQLPPDSPNYFLLNMTPQQVPQVTAFLAQHHIQPSTFYPIVRVRLTEINQQLATERVSEDSPGGEAVNRELNLTWQQDLPAHNVLTAGQWPPKADEVSMEQGIADRLGIKIGDKLTFSGDTQSFGATVSSIRQVDWDSLRPNFYFIFPPGALDQQPQTWLTSFRYHGDGEALVQLNRQFPTLSLLDIGAMLKQVGQVLQQVSRALEVMVVLVILCGTLLLLAQVQVGMRQRRQELVVYRTLGASKRLLRGTLWWEFALLGLVAGLAAAIGAEAALWALQRLVFDFPWQPNWMMWWILPLAGASLLSVCGGWLGVRLLRGQALFRRYE